jgi:oligoribonuclease
MMSKASLLWLDLEMTGLDPAADRILEVAAIATDWKFKEIAKFKQVVNVNPELLERRMVGEFWDKFRAVKRKLIEQNQAAEFDSRQVERHLIEFIKTNFNLRQPIYLAGNSIHQDRKFIESEWPDLNQLLHYRMLDVSAWKIVFAEHFGDEFKKPEKHRAEDDIKGSMAELKYYLSKVGDAKS